jgi:serine/threonine protein kinase
MGVVYRALDPMIDRFVAIKTITVGLAERPDVRERFYREAKSAGRLQHPNIVTIYDMGEQELGGDRIPYIAMELIDGESLEAIIANQAGLSILVKLDYAMQACRAFNHAHKHGIVHRDIKPANVMVDKEGTVKVVDFGIARILETSKTRTGILIGTLAYMSPEQFEGKHATELSDIWSFGVMLYELVSSRRPFSGDSLPGLMMSVRDHHPEPLTGLIPSCTAEIDSVIGRCLQKSPSNRFQSMQHILIELEPLCKNLRAQTVAELKERGLQSVAQHRFAEAQALLRQALEIEPNDKQARILCENLEANRTFVGSSVVQTNPRIQHLEIPSEYLQLYPSPDAAVACATPPVISPVPKPAQLFDLQTPREGSVIPPGAAGTPPNPIPVAAAPPVQSLDKHVSKKQSQPRYRIAVPIILTAIFIIIILVRVVSDSTRSSKTPIPSNTDVSSKVSSSADVPSTKKDTPSRSGDTAHRQSEIPSGSIKEIEQTGKGPWIFLVDRTYRGVWTVDNVPSDLPWLSELQVEANYRIFTEAGSGFDADVVNLSISGPETTWLKIEHVEYYFRDGESDRPSPRFRRPTKTSKEHRNGFKITYKGSGCVDWVRITIFPRPNFFNKTASIEFPFCQVIPEAQGR